MIKLELIVIEDKVDDIKELLREIGIKKISFSDIRIYDEDNIHVEGYRGSTYVVEFTNKVKIEVLLDSAETIDRALDMISATNIETEVLIYQVMKSYLIKKHAEEEQKFSFGDIYRKVMNG